MGAPAPKIVTDEWIDHRMSRPLAALVVAALRRTPVTANQVTLVTGLLGVGAAFGLARGTPLSLTLSAAGILGVLVLDCADGQLARARGGGSRLGRVLDGACDYVTGISLHVATIVYLAQTRHAGLPSLPAAAEIGLVVASGILLAVRSGIYDDLKGRVRRAGGAGEDERDTPESVAAELSEETRPLARLFLRAYLVYCRIQATPADEGARGATPAEPPVRALRAWSVLGPSTYLLALAVATAASARWPDGIRWFLLLSVGPGTLAMLTLLPLARRSGQAE